MHTRHTTHATKGDPHMRDAITFKCTVCGEENYISTRNKKKHPEKMEVKKYCPFDREHTLHKETK